MVSPLQVAVAVAAIMEADKKRKLAADLKEDPAGLCPARCDTERYWGHDYDKGVCTYCDRVED